MTAPQAVVDTPQALQAATQNAQHRDIVVRGALSNLPTIRLAPGQRLVGEDADAALAFAAGVDGLQLSADNEIAGLRIEASADRRAIFNDTGVEHLGWIRIARVATVGQVQILVADRMGGGHVDVDGLDVIAADARGRADRPQGYGVHVTQGAFTLWNMRTDPAVVVSARLVGLSAGRPSAPVLGSGIFVSGTPDGGRLSVPLLETGAVYSDGRIAPGTQDQITGGVFTVTNAFVDVVRNRGPVVTYGVNDMVLDNWGTVDRWDADEKLTSYGPSGIGFVNFGTVNELRVHAPIETFGQGARGFNVYDGTVNVAEFDRITTHADGAVGIQISQPIGRLAVHRGIETFGGTGDSLVKGVVVRLSAVPLSIKPGGAAREIDVEGGVVAHGEGIAPLEVHGTIGTLRIDGVATAATVA
ncbi:hypothetical protein [Burkholderia guangdongensis]|uniref:hypothetical protein n=1 Tax=Burkholderia guangdongensis TaxID=1792500 RepID=UPI0015C6F9CA|nr:hypothetical protein [Burkholderia guangdongensis]